MFDKEIDRVTDFVEEKIGKVHFLELSVLLLLGSGSVYLVSHSITRAAVMAAALWVPVGLWYVLVFYRERFRPDWKIWILALAVLTSGAWAFWFVQFLTETHREIVQDLNAGREDYLNGDYSNAGGKFSEALCLAHRSGDKYREAESLLNLGNTEFMLGQGVPEHTQEAENDFQRSLGLTDDPQMQVRIRIAQGRLDDYAGQADQARQRLLDAMGYAEKLKPRDALLEAAVLGAEGDVENKALNREKAIDYYRRASELYTQKSGRTTRWRHVFLGWIHGDHTELDTQAGKAEIFLDLGDLESKVENLEEAQKDYNQAIDLFNQIHQGRGEAYALVGLGSVDTIVSKNEEARKTLGVAKGLYINDRQGQADVYFNLGELERTLGNSKEAFWDYKNALDRYGVTDDLDRVNVFVGQAELETVLGDYTDADKDLSTAEGLAHAADEPVGKMMAFQARAELDSELGQKDKVSEAHRYYETVLSFFQGDDDKLGKADVLLDLGKWESKFGDSNQARTYYDGANKLFKIEGVQIGQADALFYEGELEFRAGNYAQAISDYEAAQKIYESDPVNIYKISDANVLLGLGEAARAKGRTKDARDAYEKARGIYSVQNSLIGLANVDLAEGKLSDASGKPGDKSENLTDARELYVRMEKRDKVREVDLELDKLKGSASAQKHP